MNKKEWTLEEAVEVLTNQAELKSFPKAKYREQHLSLKMPGGAFTSGLFCDGMPPVHEIWEGVPDFREPFSDRMAATFNACKGIPVQALNDGIIAELIYAVQQGNMEDAKSFASELTENGG